MMMRKRHTTGLRVLSLLVGMVFFASAGLAYGIPCACGGSCCEKVATEPTPSPTPKHHGEDGPCCPTERQNDAPEPAAPSEPGHTGGCLCCIGELQDGADHPALAKSPGIKPSTENKTQQAAAATPAGTAAPALLQLEDAPKWRPTRGSPLPHPSLHELYSVFII